MELSWLHHLHSKKIFLNHPVEDCATELFSFSCVSCTVSFSCRESFSWILVYLDRIFLLENIWQLNIWLTSQGNYPLNRLPQYFTCWNELIHISWFTQENTVAVKSWRFLHWTRNFLRSTVTMDLPWPFNDFLLRVYFCPPWFHCSTSQFDETCFMHFL